MFATKASAGQAPARYLTLRYDRERRVYMMHCCIQVDSISISWTGWRRITLLYPIQSCSSEQGVWSPYPIALVCRQSSKAFLSTSGTVWLTKAVDISVSCPVHVVVYTVPACPAPSRCVSLFRHNSSSYYTLVLLTQQALCILLGCWGLRRPPVLLAQRTNICMKETISPCSYAKVTI